MNRSEGALFDHLNFLVLILCYSVLFLARKDFWHVFEYENPGGPRNVRWEQKILFCPIRPGLVPLQLLLKKPLEQERLLQAQSGDPLPGEGASGAQ